MSSMIFILYPSMIVKDTQRHSFLCEWIGIFEKIEYLCNALALEWAMNEMLLFLS